MWEWPSDVEEEGGVSGGGRTRPPKFLSLIMPFVRPIVGEKLRNRFYTHSGSTDELQERLSKFGLGTKEMLPEMFGGKLEFV